MASQGGWIRPDLQAARLTIGNVTVPISTNGDTPRGLSPEEVRHLVEQIQRALTEQARRNWKRKEGDDEGNG